MRNPLNLRNTASAARYLATYVENRFARENPFPTRSRRTVDPWPTLAGSRELLPAPHLPAQPAAAACYWRCWEIAFANFRHATNENGFISDYSSTMWDDALFIWDSVFITLFGRYGDRAWKFQNTLDNFYAKQHPDGGICRQLRELDGSEVFSRFDPAGSGPNLLAWSEWEFYRFRGDRGRLADVFFPLAAHAAWHRRYRTWPNGSYWGTGWATGMDNQPRTPAGAHLWFDHGHRTWVDTNLQAVFNNRLLVKIAAELGREEEVLEATTENSALIPWINQHLWDEETGFYHDLRRDQTRTTELKTIGAYWALLADVVPRERLDRFVQHLESNSEFRRVHRVPSLSADTPGFDPDGGYWLGGVWAPTNYMVLRGLTERGYHDLAYTIAENHFQNVMASFEATESIWEHFAPDSEGEGRGRHDFVGWTAITPIAVLFEYVIGLRSEAVRGELCWDVRRLDEHGVHRYPFGGQGSVDLVCEARASIHERPKLRVKSNVPLKLRLIWAGGEDVIEVQPS
ncbi:MAG TPA: trehalase family glycosidase [Polyangiaceae bacterium]